jgi:putative ABC transport system ATP-binding protein
MREGHDVASLGAGDFLGEAALITGEPRNAKVVAKDNLDNCVLGKADFRAAIEASRSFRDQLYRVYCLRD